MKILKAELKNWQAHEDLILNFSDINIISGLSNVGKSCIRRALAWVCFGLNMSEEDYRREGTKETSVKIILDNGFTIERLRSDSLNRYVLSKDGFEDKVFDSFGRDIPNEIKEILNVSEVEVDGEKINLNIAEQLTLPFLLDKSATFRAKLFNKLTGNEVLDKTFKELNKENLQTKKDIKAVEETIKEHETDLEEYVGEYLQKKGKLQKIEKDYIEIKDKIVIYENLKDLSEKLKNNQQIKNSLEDKKTQIKIISDNKIKELKDKAILLEKYITLFKDIETIKDNTNKLKEQRNKIKDVSIDFVELKNKNENLQQLKETNEKFNKIDLNKQRLEKQIKETQKILEEKEKELGLVWKELSVCPLCKNKIGEA